MKVPVFIGWAACLLIAACGPEIDDPDYTTHSQYGAPRPFFVGQRPFDPAVPRIGFRQFGYEGRQTESALADFLTLRQTRFIFVFDTAGDGSGDSTISNVNDVEDRVEGIESFEVTHAGFTFAGAGIFDNEPRDFSEFVVFHLALKSEFPSLTDISLNFESGIRRPADAPGNISGSAVIRASEYGYVNDGAWHFLDIPMRDLIDQGFDPARFRNFFYSLGAANAGETFLIDDVYFEGPR